MKFFINKDYIRGSGYLELFITQNVLIKREGGGPGLS